MRLTALFSFLALAASALALGNQYIVLLLKDASIDDYLAKITAVAPVEVVTRWDPPSLLHGVVVRTDGHTLQTLGAYPEVDVVEPDQVITIPDCSKGPCRRVLAKAVVAGEAE
ncbi:hypothetical protein ACHAQA_005885 [Verticillium albo-atrum]